MNKSTATIIAILVTILLAPAANATITIATFADPAADSSTPLFTVNFGTSLITGGWMNDGLDLIVLNSVTYPDAVFTMTDITITSDTDPLLGYKTQGGTIKFLESDETTEILTVVFNTGWVNFFGLGGADFESEEVTITGPALGNMVLDDESFAFSFTNYSPLYVGGSYRRGYSATASFTSSAIVPEPATMMMLGLGSLFVITKRKQKI